MRCTSSDFIIATSPFFMFLGNKQCRICLIRSIKQKKRAACDGGLVVLLKHHFALARRGISASEFSAGL